MKEGNGKAKAKAKGEHVQDKLDGWREGEANTKRQKENARVGVDHIRHAFILSTGALVELQGGK